MRFNFPVVVLDLETTDCDGHAVIQVGAVLLDNQLRRWGGGLSCLVRPDRPVSDFVVGLTGHSREALGEAAPWPEAAARFENWVADKAGAAKKVRLAAWGNYFDVAVLRAQYARHGLAYPFSGTCLDVKTVALVWCALAGKRTDSLSVKKTAEYMGLEPVGPYHDAHVDAEITARIFQRAVADLGGGVWVDKKYVRVTPEGTTPTFGSTAG